MSPKHLAANAALALALAAPPAHALPKVGDARPNVALRDAWNRTLDLGRIGPRPLLVVYEDKESSSQNQPFKDELSKIAKGPGARNVVLAAVADLQGYDYWPARGFVKDAIRSQSRQIGADIYCDWSGALRTTLGLAKGQSTVLLYDVGGRVVFAHQGRMDAATRERALALLSSLAGG